jgi:bacterioferritin
VPFNGIGPEYDSQHPAELIHQLEQPLENYFFIAEMCEDWGYTKLHESFEKRAIVEMKHAEKLIGRILFLEGTPIVTELNKIHIGDNVPKQLENDHKAEEEAIAAYNEAIVLAGEVKDYATRTLLQEILQDEDSHVDELEEYLDQIDQMGLSTFLSTQF